jgi:hypothetical protein
MLTGMAERSGRRRRALETFGVFGLVVAIPVWVVLAGWSAVSFMGAHPDRAELQFSAGVLGTGAVVVLTCCSAVAARRRTLWWLGTGVVLSGALTYAAVRFGAAAGAARTDSRGSTPRGYGEGVLWALAAPTSWPLLATGAASLAVAVRRSRTGHGT